MLLILLAISCIRNLRAVVKDIISNCENKKTNFESNDIILYFIFMQLIFDCVLREHLFRIDRQTICFVEQ